MIYVAGDRVVTDALCKPFSMGRNLFCVHSKVRCGSVPAAAAAAAAAVCHLWAGMAIFVPFNNLRSSSVVGLLQPLLTALCRWLLHRPPSLLQRPLPQKHIDDIPELKAEKQAMNRRTLKAMQVRCTGLGWAGLGGERVGFGDGRLPGLACLYGACKMGRQWRTPQRNATLSVHHRR